MVTQSGGPHARKRRALGHRKGGPRRAAEAGLAEDWVALVALEAAACGAVELGGGW